MSEQDWSGIGRMTIEGAAKYGHIRKDLRAKPASPEGSSIQENDGTFRALAKRALRILFPSSTSPEDLRKHYE